MILQKKKNYSLKKQVTELSKFEIITSKSKQKRRKQKKWKKKPEIEKF